MSQNPITSNQDRSAAPTAERKDTTLPPRELSKTITQAALSSPASDPFIEKAKQEVRRYCKKYVGKDLSATRIPYGDERLFLESAKDFAYLARKANDMLSAAQRGEPFNNFHRPAWKLQHLASGAQNVEELKTNIQNFRKELRNEIASIYGPLINAKKNPELVTTCLKLLNQVKDHQYSKNVAETLSNHRLEGSWEEASSYLKRISDPQYNQLAAKTVQNLAQRYTSYNEETATTVTNLVGAVAQTGDRSQQGFLVDLVSQRKYVHFRDARILAATTLLDWAKNGGLQLDSVKRLGSMLPADPQVMNSLHPQYRALFKFIKGE